MIDAVIKETAIKEANQAFTKQVTNQVARITGELNRLEQLLSAGMVDRRVLSEFRRQGADHGDAELSGPP